MKSIANNKLRSVEYLGRDVVKMAISFLGAELHTIIDGTHTAGRIVEVEAYCGATDRACHAFPDKRTSRTQTMYRQGGVAYVYLVYGLHYLFNIVTNVEGFADAVLVRAVEPLVGLPEMMRRRDIYTNDVKLTGGPARLTQALGIKKSDDGVDLTGDRIWLARSKPVELLDIIDSERIGVEYAGEDARLPWRFYIRGNKYVSK